jgi:hypothetical protein
MHPKLAINSVRLGEPLDEIPFTMVSIGLAREKLVAGNPLEGYDFDAELCRGFLLHKGKRVARLNPPSSLTDKY